MSKEAPGHTDLMVCPESLDKWLEENPLELEETTMALTPGETVFCRFTGEAFTVVSYAGGVVVLSDGTYRARGDLTRRAA